MDDVFGLVTMKKCYGNVGLPCFRCSSHRDNRREQILVIPP